jgi:uncharacterized protein YbgA (DUF1722 family)/uncharacterized protein YbbK (DUF523 family)
MKSFPLNEIKIGLSSCLMGNPVRYNGDGVKQDWIVDVLQKHVKLISFCPEVSMGLGVPRPAMRLIREFSETKNSNQVTLKEINSQKDHTQLAETTAKELAEQAQSLNLDGFIFKKDSPTCGLERVKIYEPKGSLAAPTRKGIGFFADKIKEMDPLMPLIEEGRLMDTEQRDQFLCEIFAYAKLKSVPPQMHDIEIFHRTHKLFLMEHSPAQLKLLGQIVGNAEHLTAEEVHTQYKTLFMNTLKNHKPTLKSRTNVLQHAQGYLKKVAEDHDRKSLDEFIQSYRLGEVPFISPLTLLQHLIKKFKITYLEEQVFFGTFPKALGSLRRL